MTKVEMKMSSAERQFYISGFSPESSAIIFVDVAGLLASRCLYPSHRAWRNSGYIQYITPLA